ncbi:ATP-binding protein [Myxococcus virescens]|uniref:IstB-like ATP-binding domain-containing protein n=1 Tax=Myxococcus virescens TaxID=83456 RepID=A0A511HPQ0_9BACT|nr:hypothetical protein MVI01_73500 [Myxococcus virescens]
MAGKHNVLLTGPAGVGKSFLAPALGMSSLRGGGSLFRLTVPVGLEGVTLGGNSTAQRARMNWKRMNRLIVR